MSENIAIFGGVYNNHVALQAVLEDARRQGASQIYCLGDLGGFGPNPDRVFPLLEQYDVRVIQGNYDYSIGHQLADCGCGYTDPRDNHYAQISYDYTLQNTSAKYRTWLRQLPDGIRFSYAGREMLLVHGSPRKTNEFLWESTTPDAFLEKLLTRYEADILCCTHTGLHWKRTLPSGKWVVNVGAIGRPANNGETAVYYALFEAASNVTCRFVPVHYDVEALAREMREEQLPEEFVETILTGWWTTCLENMPRIERAQGKY